jgi:threonine synthase
MWKGIIQEYKKFLPVTEKTPIISLQEGATPLIRIDNLTRALGLTCQWHVKFEGANPTGSFKDRGMTLAISKAKENKAKMVICASTGNTSAAAAAYAARANLACCVLIPEGKIALGKLSQAMMLGAIILQIKGNFDDAMHIVKDIAAEYPITLVNSLNPFRIEGQKSGAFEIVDFLGYAPDYHFIPVGNAGNITAYWKGYKEYKEAGKIQDLPKMMGFQAAGSAPLVHKKIITSPETIATAIRIGNPANWTLAEKVLDESNGAVDMVSDKEILESQRLLAKYEGIFCEPASAASIAGVIKFNKIKPLKKQDKIVSILTGNGLKDPHIAQEICEKPKTIANSLKAVKDVLLPYLE